MSPRRLNEVLGLVLGVAVIGASGCSRAPDVADIEDRLWVSKLPTSGKEGFSAVLITGTDNHKVGAFYRGSLYRGAHEAFAWRDGRKSTATLTTLQDGVDHAIRTETCEPSEGFDYCVLLHGDPTKAVRYQSRKRWSLGRGKKKKDVPSLIVELADESEDEDLEALAAILDPE